MNYTTETLLGMLDGSRRPKRFLLELFFPREQTFDTKFVTFEEVKASRRLAPFVSPLVKGKAMPVNAPVAKTFEPPYLKPKHILDPTMPLKRRAGESLGGSLTPAQRKEAIRLQLLQDQDDQITRREEWMAAQLLTTGKMIVEAEDHPPMVVDLDRAAGHTTTLVGAARWGESGVSAYKYVRSRGAEVGSTSGYAPRTVVFDPLAAELFLADPFIEKNFGLFHQPDRNLDLLGSLAEPDEAVFLGALGGFEFWQYQAQYVNDAGQATNYMPDYSMILGSVGGGEGIRTYGAILDMEVLRAMSRYPKEWPEQDPSATFIMTQSAPLPLIPRPDATAFVKVR